MIASVRQLFGSSGAWFIVVLALVWVVIFIFLEGFGVRFINDGRGIPAAFLDTLVSFHDMLIIFSLIIGPVLLLRRKWTVGFSLIGVACLLYVSQIASLALSGDDFLFTAASHRENAKIYAEQRSGFAVDKEQFFDLAEACHPPGTCKCWLLFDPNHASGAEADVGRWHPPRSGFFPEDAGFSIVDVRKIDQSTYSVIGCSMDLRGWSSLPLWIASLFDL